MNFHRLTRLTAPSDLIVSLVLAKQHLRVAHDGEDDLITGLIEAADAFISGPHGLGIALLDQSWRLSLDAFPAKVSIPLRPVTAVSSVTYQDAQGAQQTLAPTAYAVDLDTASITPALGSTWPVNSGQPGSVKITFRAGDGDVPADLKAAALLIIGHLYRNREAVVGIDGTASPLEVPLGVEAIFSRYRVVTCG